MRPQPDCQVIATLIESTGDPLGPSQTGVVAAEKCARLRPVLRSGFIEKCANARSLLGSGFMVVEKCARVRALLRGGFMTVPQ